MSTHFEWHIQDFLVAKDIVSPCHWKLHCALFLSIQRILVAMERFMASGSLVFFFSLSSLKNYKLTLFVIDISTPVIILLIFYFFGSFIKF
jgi:hypothetical protein